MNRCYVTGGGGKVYRQLEEVLSDWHEGRPFKIYQHQIDCTIHSCLQLRMSGFTHVCFVWQDEDMRVQHHDLELK